MSAGGLKNPPPQGQAKEKSEKPLPNEKVQQVDQAASNTTSEHHQLPTTPLKSQSHGDCSSPDMFHANTGLETQEQPAIDQAGT